MHKKTSRISETVIDEREMIAITVNRHPDIFKEWYPRMTNQQITDEVFLRKPTRLKDLLYIAAHDLKRAMDMANARNYRIADSSELKNIP